MDILFQQLLFQQETVLHFAIAEKRTKNLFLQNLQSRLVQGEFTEIFEIYEPGGIGFLFGLLIVLVGSAEIFQKFVDFLLGRIQIIPYPLARTQFLEEPVRFLEEFRPFQMLVFREEFQFQFSNFYQCRLSDDAEPVDIRSLPHEPKRREELLDFENPVLAQLVAVGIDKKLEFGIDRGNDDLVFFHFPGQNSFLIRVFRIGNRLFLFGFHGGLGTGATLEFVIGLPGFCRGISLLFVGSVGAGSDADELVSQFVHELLVRFENISGLDFTAFFLSLVNDFEIEKPPVGLDRSRDLMDVDNGIPVFMKGFPGNHFGIELRGKFDLLIVFRCDYPEKWHTV